ncbi:SMC5-SMC6 complex localization factor protein 1 isoform X2 [Sceloporus undulatus]|nr:SMC5-SMC6 complex localization factor protein 1 isoform X2 [Sceloporus undulatus]
MQSAPKRWREELTCSGAAGAFHRWKVVLLVMRGDKRKDSLIRVLEAGKASIYPAVSAPKDITHVLTNTALNQESEKVFGAPCFPVGYLGAYLLENEIRSDLEKYQENNLQSEQELKEMVTDTHLGEMRRALIRHIYFQQAMLSKYTQTDQMNECRKEVRNSHCSRRKNSILEELVDDQLFSIAITEFLSWKDLIPPVKFLHSLLEHILQGNSDSTLSVQFFHIMYTLLQYAPPSKSPSMLSYYLEILQCPVCMRGTWPLMEMLVRSCLYCKGVCHSVPVSEIMYDEKTFHKNLIKFILNLFQAEVLALTRSLYEGVDSHLQMMPETVLQKTFWLGNESVLFTKQINILTDWVTNSYKEKYKTKDIFKHEVAELLNGILGTVVEYWILSGFMMDRNVLHPVADDLASYIVISCDDFSPEELKIFVTSIPSLWLEMYVAEAVFKKFCYQTNTFISTEQLSLEKIVCSYLPVLQIWMRETGNMQKGKREKIGQWPCPESQRALLMLNGDKQNQAEVLPDVPAQNNSNSAAVPKKLKNKAKIEMSHGKENNHSSAKQTNIYKVNIKGETAVHLACKSNNVKKLIHLLSLPGIDINVKDNAGWTPLHEACNHGSTVCVREILQHCPEVNLFSQVNGVTPLHDALSNGHVEIAELLLQHGGPILLEQKDSEGNFPLDHINCVTTKQHLLNVVKIEETAEEFHAKVESSWYNQQTEFWTVLFCKMLLNFCSVYNLFKPFSVSIKKSTCSHPFLVTADGCKFNTSHWLINLYFREIDTFQNLPYYLQETIENLTNGPGEQKNAFVAALQQISMTVQMSRLNLTNSLPK